MKIAIGSDHGGYTLKELIITNLKEKGYDVADYGTDSTKSVDYPEFGEKVAIAVKNGEADRGIVICGTGIGISISANKVPGIRAALASDTYSARMSREHNDANILALGARVIGPDLAMEIVNVWISTEFAGDRHMRRVNQITEIEERFNQ